MGSSPEETELSITLTLRMLMHGKVMAGEGGLGAARGGSAMPRAGGHAGAPAPCHSLFFLCTPNPPREQHSQKDFFPHPKPG